MKGYSLDNRALSLMRIGVALVVISDLLIRGSDLSAHYTDEGMWPTNLVHNFGWKGGFWSLHELSGSFAWVFLLFSVHFVAAIFLLIGYKTRWANLVVWLLYISLHNRNLFVQQSGDDLLRLVLFWGLFLPWNLNYSVDGKKILRKKKQHYFANLGYLLLISSVYFFTVNLKYSDEWRSDGSAVYYALSLEQLRLPVGDWLYQFPGLMKMLTWFTYYTEFIIPVFLLWPQKKGYLRLIAFVLILILHTGIGLTLYVGLFFVINMVTVVGVLPSNFINYFERIFDKRFKTHDTRAKVAHLDSARSDTSGIQHSKLWGKAATFICIIVIVLSVIINLSSIRWFGYELKKTIWYPVNALRLDQYWGMFSPSVLKRDGWFVYHGMDSIGRQWDLRNNADYVDYKKPEHIVSMYKTDRWRKLAENMQRSDFTFLRPRYCQYVLREWNKKHPEKQIMHLNLYYMQKESLPDYKTTVPEKVLFCICTEM